ncbi:MAG: tetratricopeptide repeat protein [Phormidesmis sp.]
MKTPSSSFSVSWPSMRLPDLRSGLWQLGIALAALFLGLTIWLFSSQVSVPIVDALVAKTPIADRSAEVQQPSVEVSFGHAMQLRQSGNLVAALHELEQVAAIDPVSVPVLYELGRAEFQLGEIRSAIAHYRAAVSVDSSHAPSAYELGSMLVTLGNVDEGIQRLQQAVSLSPKPLYFYDLGIALGRAGQPQAKIDALEAALALDPNYADAHLNLGLTYARLNNISEAKHSLQRARDLYQAEIETIEHAHLGRNSLDAQIIDQMLLALDSGCGVECWANEQAN